MQRKHISVLILSILFIASLKAQNVSIKMDTVLYTGDTLINISFLNSNEVKTSKVGRDDYNVFFNNENIDSTGMLLNGLPVLFDNTIYLNPSYKNSTGLYKKLRISDAGEIESYSSTFSYNMNLQQLYLVSKDLLKIYTINPIIQDQKLFFDFSDIVERDLTDEDNYPLEEIENVCFINKEKAIVRICNYGPYASCWKSRYFLVKKGGIKEEITNKFNYDTEKEIESFTSSIQFVSNGFVREKIDLQIIENKSYQQLHKNRLFDESFIFISELLFIEPSIAGVYIQKYELEHYFLRSFLNNEEKVIIPYKFIPELDLAMYKAYNNENLTKEELKGFGEYELGILRNLIFAKYNYDFSSEFYQAYFNLYAFYNAPDMRNSRTKDVNEKLTAADKANLELIKGME